MNDGREAGRESSNNTHSFNLGADLEAFRMESTIFIRVLVGCNGESVIIGSIMIDMFIIKDEMVRERKVIGEASVASPHGVNKLGLVLIIRGSLVQIHLLDKTGLCGVTITLGSNGNVLAKLDSAIFAGLGHLKTKAALKVFRVIELNIIQRLGVITDTSSILMHTRSHLESV